MIVLDASVLSNLLGDDGHDGKLAREIVRADPVLAAPDLVDVETVSVLRRRWLAGLLTEQRFAMALEDMRDLEIDRFPGLPLMARAFELRANVTPHDATYVALAETLGCALVTADGRLARTPGVHCRIELIGA